ncbi:MAG: aspartate--tRNA ligase [bacterium (Candidatus Stahlbacteria) CG08_land_8_20_14_0_20_40_26]|nr:MAG: aspartate--tRNA ligase [bacterium (Candidatus Stahlbacteria) CG23_combo_of_CG06-09_8_20_14_all_40_9]PIS24286.1 MAG: aspartate--tRNA ligase [bacterium (Candidatus Stahlbacteria) CG08_land_8_20_14_0_20_40_26]
MRTHTCGELRAKNSGENVTLQGWIDAIRDHGKMVFISLRDRYGVTQVVLADAELIEKGKKLGGEYVVEVEGMVRERPSDMRNPSLETGKIEVVASRIKLISSSSVPPFVIKDPATAKDELRMKYRYLDLRRPSMQKNLIMRSKLINTVRAYLLKKNFLEIETPCLTRTTTEGARNFVVPSRNFKGKFYSLAQSPQIYKQLLMIAGVDRYFQFAKCFRDEDQRADRQPEHTQIDLEMSFVDEEEVMELVEGMIQTIFENILGLKVKVPFERLTYRNAMEQYGTDKPETRFDVYISDITKIAKKSEFRIFKEVKFVRALTVPLLTRKRTDEFSEFALKYYNSRISYLSFKETISGNIAKFFSSKLTGELKSALSIRGEETVLFCAGDWKRSLETLGAIRNKVLEGKTPREKYKLLWVTDFPLFEWDNKIGSWAPCHHIFTMPKTDNFKDPSKVAGKQYDLVLNGIELGSGSIRIHDRDLQERMMEIGGMNRAKRDREFGFFLSALTYGTPPHGGIAIGLDRLLMILAGKGSIQEVIPFPKTLTGAGLMEDVPSEIENEKLKELGIKITSTGNQ